MDFSKGYLQNGKSSLDKNRLGSKAFVPVISRLRLTTTTFSTGGFVDSRFSIPTFLTLGFQIVLHPFRRALGLVHLYPLSGEYVYLLGSPFAKSDICMTAIGCLQSRCLGDPPVKTPISLLSLSRRAKFLISFSAMMFLLHHRYAAYSFNIYNHYPSTIIVFILLY